MSSDEFLSLPASAQIDKLTTLAEKAVATWDLFIAARSLTYLGWAHTRPNSDEAKELAPFMIANAVEVCSTYLNGRDG